MHSKKGLYLYPITSFSFKEGENDYIKNLCRYLSLSYTIINKPTRLGILNAFIKIPKFKIIYFNWIEDLPDKRFGQLQVCLLLFVLIFCRILNKQIIWFIHNNYSHYNKNIILKKFIVMMMNTFSNVILCHSNELKINVSKEKLHVFPHPVESYRPIISNGKFKFDLLVWGTVSAYKGIDELIEYNTKNVNFQKYNILIAGKFNSKLYYDFILNKKSVNISLINKVLTQEELLDLFKQSKYILFTYNSPSILGSAALSKSLSYGKEIIGPNIGSFKELGNSGLIFTYDKLDELDTLLSNLFHQEMKINKNFIEEYINKHSWEYFARFILGVVENTSTN